MKIVGIYLAAGNSSRMGTNKLALKIRNKQMGIWALEEAIASDLDKVIIVNRKENQLDFSDVRKAKLIWKEIQNVPCGQSYSLIKGIEQAEKLDCDAVMIVLADQPFITSKMLNLLIATFKYNLHSSFIASSNQGQIQPPILISNNLFPELKQIRGDQGAKSIIEKNRDKGILVPFDDQQLFIDIDDRADYAYWKNRMENHF